MCVHLADLSLIEAYNIIVKFDVCMGTHTNVTCMPAKPIVSRISPIRSLDLYLCSHYGLELEIHGSA